MDPSELGVAWDVVRAVGRAIEDLGARNELDPQRVALGDESDHILDRVAVALGDEALGLTLARRIPVGGMGVIDYAFCSAATVRDGLRTLGRHFGLLSERVTLSVVERPPRASVVIARRPGVAYSGHWIDFVFAMTVLRIRQTTRQPMVVHAVQLSRQAPRDRGPHDAFFETTVEFSRSPDRLEIDAAILDEPLVTAATRIGEFLDGLIRAQAKSTNDALLERVRRAVAALDEDPPRLPQIAKQLKLSTRSLQRELRSRRTSFSALVDEVRRDRAHALLADPRRSVAEVANELGFADASSFFRAFRRWTGNTPRATSTSKPRRS